MCKTIKHKVRFKAAPREIYDLLADSKKRTAVTGRKADISRKVGGAFSTDAGHVTGVNVDLVPGKRLVQAWRRRDFPDGVPQIEEMLGIAYGRGGVLLKFGGDALLLLFTLMWHREGR